MKTHIIIVVAILISVQANAQDIHYVNQDLTKTLLNPSYAGINDKDFIAGIIYREQWSQLQKIYRTYSFASELLLNSQNRSGGNIAFGIWYDRDDAGTAQIATNQLGLSVAYHAKIAERQFFSGGIYGGMLNKHLSQDNMQWDSQYNGSYYDGSLSSNEDIRYFSYTKPDVGAGISYMFNNRDQKDFGQMFRVGIAMYHLNKPDMTFTDYEGDELYRNLVMNASGIIDLPHLIVSLNPAFTYMRQGPSHEMLFGVNGIFDVSSKSKLKGGNIQSMWVGMHYRAGDAAIMEIGIKTYDVSVTFSYDWTVSLLKGNGIDAFEIGLKYSKNIFKHTGNRLL